MTSSILEVTELGMPWVGVDPFIFTVHHRDRYPAGSPDLGPSVPLSGRNLGADFSYLDGWSMYHGERVPGFPQHPHRGFETVTVVRRGYVDHSDSLGATARYGGGDTQWLTTGSGIMHAEMFPLLDESGPNPLELFQIWFNLPPHSKMVPAHFAILWSEDIPSVPAAPGVTVDVIAGGLDGHTAPTPPPDSWASQPGSEVAIWLLRMDVGAVWTVPAMSAGLTQVLHFYSGDRIEVDDTSVSAGTGVHLDSQQPTRLRNVGDPAEILLLQGRPIGAPVFQMGPFVMNTPEELQTAFADYRRTQFGGWPWPSRSHVHPQSAGRFALHADGRVERRDMQPVA